MSKPQILLLHGALGAERQLAPLAERLGAYLDVHTLDFEGHGEAPAGDRPFRTRYFAENVLAYMDGHGLDAAHLFGYSMGGYVGLHLALSQPRRIRSLFTLATKLAWTPELAAREVRFLEPDRIAEKVPAFAQELEGRHRAFGWRNVLAATDEMMRALGNRPDLDIRRFTEIGQRVRIAVGDRDQLVTVEECLEAYRVLPAGELQILPATPHPLEKVSLDVLAAALLEFFEER